MERIGNAVAKELSRSGSSAGSSTLAEVTAAWPEVVGPAIARNAWPRRIARDGTLHVATTSATWSNELALLGEELLGRLRARLGGDAPSKVRFAVGPVPEPDMPHGQVPAEAVGVRPDATAAERAEADSVAAAIADPELRELVARAARASLVRTRSGRSFW